MRVLVIGSGGREHALAWKLAQSPRVQKLYVAPGNGGTALDGRMVNVAITDPVALAEFAVADMTAKTLPPDFAHSRPHRSFRLTRR